MLAKGMLFQIGSYKLIAGPPPVSGGNNFIRNERKQLYLGYSASELFSQNHSGDSLLYSSFFSIL